MDRESLIAQAHRHMERYGPAKSIQNEAEAFFEEHGEVIGPIEHAGCWAGPRRQFTEDYDPDILRVVLGQIGALEESPLIDALFGGGPDAPPPILTASQMKKLAEWKPWREKVKNALNAVDEDENPIYEDGGVVRGVGGWNYSIIGKAPSPDKYEIGAPAPPTTAQT